MLGWEFPPHISGGLGTACAGLTQALENEQVEIVFVVPKVHGDERAQKMTLISASTIPIRQKKSLGGYIEQSSNLDAINRPYSKIRKGITAASAASTRITIEVPSLLAPYHSTDEVYEAGLRRWNYSLGPDHRTLPGDIRMLSRKKEAHQKIGYTTEPFQFSGAYGPRLLEEVDRYAETVSIIASTNFFDVVHAHDWMTFRAGIAAKKVSGKPLVVHVHSTEIDRTGSIGNTTVFGIEKEGMMVADRVVAVSYWTKNVAVKHYNIHEEKIDVVHNGINPKNTEALVPSSPPLGSQIITFLGRITHQKGPMYFVEAARKVAEKFPDAHFVVAGSGDQLPAMIERIAQLRLSTRFHFTGFLKGEEINHIWAVSAVYVMPSVSEPFGIAPLEAIQSGVPVILSKQAGVGEVMPHAIKVDFWDTDAFAEAICNILRFKSLSNTLKTNGAEEIKKITWDKAAKKLTTLYYELSNKPRYRQEFDPLLPGTPAKTPSSAAVL